MTDVEQTISNIEKTTVGNTDTSKPLENQDLAAATDIDRSKNDLSNKSSGVDTSKNASDLSNIPIEIQVTDSLTKKKGNQRRIIAEDPEWNLAAVESLSSLALKSIVKNFQDKPILAGLPSKYKDKVVSLVSTDIALSVVSTVIHHESYWKRRAQAKFKLCNVSEHNNSWKQLFFEVYVQEILESFVPKTFGEESILEKLLLDLSTAADYVEKLEVRQLRPTEPPELNPATNKEAIIEGREQQKELIIKATDPLPDHFDVTLIFKHLYKLRELSLFYGVLDCGINFNWAYFGMTLTDCFRLADSLRMNNVLTSLSVRSSGIDDDKCRILAEAISKNSVLKSLNLSYNNISDIGAQALAKVLTIQETALEHINLGNNKIQKDGAIALAKSLTINSSLKHLDLRLNYVGDEGCHAICLQACKNANLVSLNLSGNGIGHESVSSICILLRRNLKHFTSWDLSSNRLANMGDTDNESWRPNEPISNTYAVSADVDVVGKAIFEAINRNKVTFRHLIYKYIQRLDLRMTNLSEEFIIGIQGILKENSLS